MEIRFLYPWYLLLIPILITYTVLKLRHAKHLSKKRKIAALILRIALFTLISFCLTQPSITNTSNKTSTIFLLDGSESTLKNKDKAIEFIKYAISKKSKNDNIGIVHFASNSAIESNVSSNIETFNKTNSVVNTNYTNIEQALRFAKSLIPSHERKRIVLLSDGLENNGDSIKEAKTLKNNGFQLQIFPLENTFENEVQLKALSIPERLRKNEKFDINISVYSNIKTEAALKLFNDRQLTVEKQISVNPGENNFVFSDKAIQGGTIIYTAEIEPSVDKINKNNKVSAFSYVEDIAKILVIQDDNNSAEELIKIAKFNTNISVIKPESAPTEIEDLQKYDCFILSNISAERLNDKFLNNLETVVKFHGKSLLVTGGDNSYALGGYNKTPLEKILPVNMEVKPKEEDPNLGLMLVIDKSGSMTEGVFGVTKLELAKEAAIRSSEILKDRDTIGIIAFDDAVQWVVRPRKADNKSEIQDTIATIRPGGGTQIIAPLSEAFESLKSFDTKLKHIILLTDGQAEKSGYDNLIEQMNKSGITLSTVAVGNSADKVLLKDLALKGNGRYYETNEFSNIPKIFAKETKLAENTYLINRSFYPQLSYSHNIIKDIDAVPQLDGYVRTSPKNSSQTIFASDSEDPIFSVWQYGLGKAAAWTPDLKGMWISKWLKWDKFQTFWQNLISWLTTQKKNDSNIKINTKFAENSTGMEISAPDSFFSKTDKLDALVISPSKTEEKITLSPSKPGIFCGEFSSTDPGVYTIVVGDSSSISTNSFATSIVVPYSPEFDISLQNGKNFLEKLAYEANGKIISSPDDVFSSVPDPVSTMISLTPYLLAIVPFLLFFDILNRRICLSLEKLGLLLVSMKKIINFFQSIVNVKINRQSFISEHKDKEKPELHTSENSDLNIDLNTSFIETKNSKNINSKNFDSKNSIKPSKQDTGNNNENNNKINNNNINNSDTKSTHISVLLEKKRKRNK